MERIDRIKNIHTQLLRISQTWASRKKYDAGKAKELRKDAILLNHSHYLENIPAYRKLASDEGIGELNDIEPIKQKLMMTDDIFKSYNQEWLDKSDFTGMNEWLSSIYHERFDIPVDGVRTIDEWIERLQSNGVTPVYSSGTSGVFSFVPRDRMSWWLFTSAPISYVGLLVANLNVGSKFLRRLVWPVTRILTPEMFVKIFTNIGLPGYDAFLLGFKSGNMGIQLVGQVLGKVLRRNHYLYEIAMNASALRAITRGVKSDEERKLVETFHSETVKKKEENYSRIISELKQVTAKGRKVFIFGAPYQMKELCELISLGDKRIALKEGSLMLFGGGWKAFTGERIERETLVKMISDTFNVPDTQIIEGYSMTEINGVIVRCEHGRFHLPPMIEPVILDDDLSPLTGNDIRGAFGFLDPFAVSYPGFIISGDNVRLQTGECACGLMGPAVMNIERAPGREVKGCGGIMAQVRA